MPGGVSVIPRHPGSSTKCDGFQADEAARGRLVPADASGEKLQFGRGESTAIMRTHTKASRGTRGRVPRRALLAAVLVTFVWPAAALAGTTPASTFSKSGRDSTTASTATANGPAGVTAAGDTLSWVLSYRNTTGGPAQVNITDPIVGNQTFVPGSLQTSPGLSPQFSTNGGTTYTTSEPPSGVNAVGATGVSVDGSTGAQGFSAAPTSGFVSSAGGGDGFEALFIGANVYNIHHHTAGGPQVDCHVKATGARCAGGYPAYVSATAGAPIGTGTNTLFTAQQPDAAISGTKIYFPASIAGGTSVGAGCVDVATNASCGYTQLGVAQDAGFANLPPIDGGAQIGSRYFMLGDQAQIYCLDTTTQSACPGYPLVGVADPGSGNNVTYASDLQTFGDGRYVFGVVTRANSTHDVVCIDASTNAVCPGFPKVGAPGTFAGGGPYNSVPVPILDAGANVIGVCVGTAADNASHPFSCFNLAGAPVATPFSITQTTGTGVNWIDFGSVLRIGAKLYFAETTPGGVSTYTCWDYATAAPCAGFVPASTGVAVYAYTLRQDPQNPDCVWEEGDADRFEVFSATIGGTTCNESPAAVDLVPAQFYCDGLPGHVGGYDRLTIAGVAAADYTGLTVTITDANGVPIPGFTGQAFPVGTTSIDISSIPYSGANAHLHVVVGFANLAAGKTATVAATFTGDPIQVCFKTTVGPPTPGGPTPIPNGATVVTVPPGGPPDPNPSGPVTFLEQSPPPSCALTAVIAGPPKQLQITVQDRSGLGLASIVATTAINASVAVPAFAPGTTAPVVVTATKTDASMSAQVGLTVTDLAGNTTVCDPVLATVGPRGEMGALTVRHAPSAEHLITIANGRPGLRIVKVDVNGHRYWLNTLKDGQSARLDVAAAMHPGRGNTIVITGNGRPRASADVVISDS